MKICEGIETGIEYPWKRSGEWEFNGHKRWWNISIKFSGFNGAGGVWAEVFFTYSNATELDKPRREVIPITTSWEEGKRIIDEVLANLERLREQKGGGG